MKLLFVHERFGALAGAEANLLATASELKQRGHTVAIAHGAHTGKGEAAWTEAFAERFPLMERDNPSAVEAALEQFEPELVYVHNMADLEVLEALMSSEAPVVRMVHDHGLYCMRSYKYQYFSRRICTRALSPLCVFPCGASLARNHDGGFPVRWVSYSDKKREIDLNRQFSRLIVATNYMKDELMRNGFNPAKVEIHAPVPRNHNLPVRSLFSNRNLIIYAGQIIRGKGVDVLLEALAQVRMPFECFIFGDGNHRAYCERLSRKLGLEKCVCFQGFVAQEALDVYYREASLMVMSSVWPEPFGAVGLEGMRHGLPVVAFDAGGIREWLTDGVNGYLVPWMDRAQFAGRVEELLENKALAREMGERGLRLVSNQYDFSSYINGLEALFEKVASEHSRKVVA